MFKKMGGNDEQTNGQMEGMLSPARKHEIDGQ